MGQLFSRNEEPPRSYPYMPSPLPPKTTSASSKPVPQNQPFNPPLSCHEIRTAIPSYKAHPFPSPAKPSPSLPNPATSSSRPSPSTTKASPSSPSSFKQPPPFKTTLSWASSNSINQQNKASLLLVQKEMSPIYATPEDIKSLIKREIVPDVLKKPLSPSTFKDFFSTLLHAEDSYIEKWSDFQLKNITLELQEAAIYKKSERNNYFNDKYRKDDKTFVAFEIDSVPEKRPFLLSRDFVFAQPLGKETEPFRGIFHRVMRSTHVLVEFGEDFHSQHRSTRKYDVSFSFNRVCLKRAHQAIEAASDPSFRSLLFPDCVPRKTTASSSPLCLCNHNLDVDQMSAVRAILNFQGSPPYLVEGPISVTNVETNRPNSKHLSRTGLVVQEAVLQIYRSSSEHRILICAPINNTCDVLMQTLMNDIPESDIFRANAAFRELDGIPDDILLSCPYEKEYFTCPLLQELRNFRVILSTFVSSFRLHNEGLAAEHFSHIFLVDASSATEPEAMVVLANLACKETTVIVTGAPGNQSGWVRSDIARKNGLRISYFERLRDRKPYSNLDSKFITQLVHSEHKSNDVRTSASFSHV